MKNKISEYYEDWPFEQPNTFHIMATQFGLFIQGTVGNYFLKINKNLNS